MGSNQFLGYRVTAADSSYSSFLPATPLIPARLVGSFKFEPRSSPSSPFSTQFDSETFTATLSDGQFSSTHNPLGGSPSSLEGSGSCHRPSPPLLQEATSSGQYMKNALQDIETTLMGPDEEEEEEGEVNRPSPSVKWVQQSDLNSSSFRPNRIQNVPPSNLKDLLMACATALSENKIDDFEKAIERARAYVSITGEPIQRLGAYMIEGLIARKELSGSNIYRTLKCKEPEGKDLLSYMHILYEICPYLKFGYMAANGAIAEACKNEDRIHIVDFQIAQGTQWTTLLEALAAKPGGPPHVRITGIDDPISKYARGDGLELVRDRLNVISEKCNIPIEFNALPVYAPKVTKEMLDVKLGEALVVNLPLQLHHTPDESVDVTNPRDERLRMIKSLSPKVVTLIEQESNTNTAAFLQRFQETLGYYYAVFESIDSVLPRDKKERIRVEQHCLARDIVNIVACEGKERVERHEVLGKWRLRLRMAGFEMYPLSSYVNSVIRSLLGSYSEDYTLVETDGALLLGWKERMLMSASAWH